MAVKPIHTWHKVVAGFLQDEGRLNGCVKLWRNLDIAHGGPDDVRVDFHSWNDNPLAIAEQIWRMRPDGEQPKVYLYAYSWGCYTATLIAKALERRGIRVCVMVFSDPVYRHYYLAGQWRALVPWTKIWIPGNVEYLYYFYQHEPLFIPDDKVVVNPRGHACVSKYAQRTKIESEQINGVAHAYMDDLDHFHDKCFEVSRWR